MNFPEPHYVETNGIRMAVYEQGPKDGVPVVMCHGFPEIAYSWRHQMPALAAAAAEEGAGAEALRAALGELEGALGAERGEGEPAPAAVAAGKGGVEACLAAASALEVAGAPWEEALGALGALLAEELGRNVFHAEGGPRDVLRRARRAAGAEEADWASAGALLEVLRLSTVKSEENKVELLLGGAGDLAAAVLARAPPAAWGTCMQEEGVR